MGMLLTFGQCFLGWSCESAVGETAATPSNLFVVQWMHEWALGGHSLPRGNPRKIKKKKICGLV